MNGEKLELRHHTEYSKGYQVIVRFFKEIGLYKEFKSYQTQSSFEYARIPEHATDPIFYFGRSGITQWIELHLGKEICYYSYTLYYPFIAFVEAFYPEFMDTEGILSAYESNYRNNPYWHIDKDKKTIRLFTKEEQIARFHNRFTYDNKNNN